MSIKCGTRSETVRDGEDGKVFGSGTAHFAEHTVFRGTQKKSAQTIGSYLDRLGGELNAYTTKEEIVIHATVLKEDLKKAASLLFELATSPVFPEEEVETEKGVVIDEINSCKDSPSEEIYDRFEEMLFTGHPLARPILGTAASVRKITSRELRRFAKEKFVPGNMAFTIVADMEEKKLAKLAENLAANFFPESSSGKTGRNTEEDAVSEAQSGKEAGRHSAGQNEANPVPENRFDKTVDKHNHQANCVIGGLAPSLYEEKDRISAVLLCNIIGGPATNSILNSVLRERNGWVYAVECTYTQYADTGIAAICLGCDRENLDKCLRAVDRELEKLRSKPLSPGRLRAAKKQLLGQIAISSDNGEAQCLSMGKALLAYGKVSSDVKNREKIEAITAEDIREAACRIFSPDKLSRLIFT